MARLQLTEDDQAALSANPWEEELWKRDEKEVEDKDDDDDEEEQEQLEASHQNILPNRNSPMPETRTQNGLSLIFGKVDRQIELLDKQVNTIHAELLQARNLVMAVRSSVANLHKPEASELLERDIFTNYLRITDRLKAIANNICMIVPDHGRQIVRVHKAYAYNPGFVYSNSDLDKPDPETSVDEWTAPDKTHSYGGKNFSEFTLDDSSSSESKSSAHTSDVIVSPPLPLPPTQEWYAPNRTRYMRRPSPSRVIYDRRRQPVLRNHHTVHFTPTVRSRSSSAVTSRFGYGSPSDSSTIEDWPRKEHLGPSRQYPYYTSTRRAASAARRRRRSSLSPPETTAFEPRERQAQGKSQIPLEEPSALFAMSKVYGSKRRAARRDRRLSSSRSEANEIKPRERLEEEEIEIDPDEPRLIIVERKDTQQAFSFEDILHEERTFLLEKLYKVQERLEAAQGRAVVQSPVRDGYDVKRNALKEKFWTRLKSKFVGHSR